MVTRPGKNFLLIWNSQACGPLEQVHRKGWALSTKITYFLYFCDCANKSKKTKMQIIFDSPSYYVYICIYIKFQTTNFNLTLLFI